MTDSAPGFAFFGQSPATVLAKSANKKDVLLLQPQPGTKFVIHGVHLAVNIGANRTTPRSYELWVYWPNPGGDHFGDGDTLAQLYNIVLQSGINSVTGGPSAKGSGALAGDTTHPVHIAWGSDITVTKNRAIGLHWIGPADDLIDCQIDYTVVPV